MSGDVQPRKRKDKKKKKEGSSLGNIHEPVLPQRIKSRNSVDEDSPILGSTDQGEKIHIDNEHGIGGNICVKIIFFCLLGALAAAVAVIFIHSRGSTDVDLPSIEDSRFSDYFTGWLDDAPDDHSHDEPELEILHDEHDEVHDEHGEHEDHEDEHDELDDHEDEHDEHDDHEIEEDVPRSEEEENADVDDNTEQDQAEENEEDEEAKQESNELEEDNAEETLHDSNEKKEDEDQVNDDSEEATGPKFKVVHRFKHFFNKRQQYTAEEKTKTEKNYIFRNKYEKHEKMEQKNEKSADGSDNTDDDGEEEESDKLEQDDDVEDEEQIEQDENEDEEEQIEQEDEDEEEQIEQDEDEEEQTEQDENEDNEGEDDEEFEAKDHDRKEGKGDDDSEEIVEREDDDGNENFDQQFDIVEEIGQTYDDSMEDMNEAEMKNGYKKKIDHDDNSMMNENKKSPENTVGLDEIDESEEDIGEEFNLEVKSAIGKKLKRDMFEEQEKEHKIVDIEEKLNQILREKRKKVEQRKMELEDIENGPIAEGEEYGKEIEEEQDTRTNGAAVKLIVGIALIIVAHLVLVQKWKSIGNIPANENTGNSTGEENSCMNKEVATESENTARHLVVPPLPNVNKIYEFEEGELDERSSSELSEERESYGEGSESDVVEHNETAFESKATWSIESSIPKTKIDPGVEEYTDEEEEEEEEESEEVEDEGEEDIEEIEDEELGEEVAYEDTEDEYLEEEGIEDENEDIEEDDYLWKRISPLKDEVEDEPPVPPPRKGHIRSASGEMRGGGPQGIDDFDVINEMFDIADENSNFAAQVMDEGGKQTDTEIEERDGEDKADEDWNLREDFKYAEEQMDNNPAAALKGFDSILSKKSNAVRALVGRAKALDKIAEKEKSNKYLKEAIEAYKLILTQYESALAENQYLELSDRCLERMRFGGFFKSAVEIHKALIRKFPNDPKHRNDLSVTYLYMNDIPSARKLLNETLRIWPKNGFALVHYGFILKTSDNNNAEGAEKLLAGINTREPGVLHGRFFFHLGDALNRLGRSKEAVEWHDRGVKEGLFLSRYQRSLYNVNRLKGQPWWTKDETTYQDFFQKLEDNWLRIREEGLKLLNDRGVNLFKEEAENLKDTGDWRQLDLYVRGRKHSNCEKALFTCSLVGSFHPASTCTRGQVKFSVMLPSTHVWPHCGPTNCRLRSHLGLVVPKNTFLRVAEETRTWEEGKVIVFDDSFEHEVWHNGTSARLVLIVDVWHPELTIQERKYLSPI